ncbi:MAG: porin [Rhodospirillales bacterium]|nr:porin [Rhodospirillales bacterium]
MKKVLYSTTALAAAGLLALTPADVQAAEKIKLGLGGYFIWGGGVGDSDSTMHEDLGAINMWAESEVYVRGNTTLDNGVRVDAIIQFETDQVNNGTQIDESYLKVGNLKQWGEFRLGSTKMAQFVVGRTSAPGVYVISNPTNFGQANLFVPNTTQLGGEANGATPATFFSHEGAADRMLAMYVTPNLNGFQAAVSYTPAHANSDRVPQTDGEDASDSENVSFGAGYKGKFGDASVGLTGGWTTVSGNKAAGKEYTTMQFGGKVGFAGFSVGAQWAEREDDGEMGYKADVEGWQAGVGYKTGPWQVALTWLNTTKDVNPMLAGEVENNQYTLGVGYSLGAGVSIGASIFQLDFQDDMIAGQAAVEEVAAVPGNPGRAAKAAVPPKMGNDNEGWGMLAGIRVNF